jgi:hypothetical protein
MKYYKSQLNKIVTDSDWGATIQIRDSEGHQTNNLDLNKESVAELIKWLTKNYLTKGKK